MSGKPKRSVEQFCRDFLEKAIEDGLVKFAAENFSQDFGKMDHPQQLTSGDLVGLANWLAEQLRAR
jgi:hypothetical protein